MYSELTAYMQNFLVTRSVGALKKELEAMKTEINEIEARNARVEQIMKDLQDRLAAAGDTTKINKIIEAQEEKT